ncbi:uncharacterized protein [Rutidosis leptorrhynchoides]|uniref:uncharacterized protein n=1 Tax=Rutidosis leptorrhynchoides TaxID=125765 RepID=UPI003A99D101
MYYSTRIKDSLLPYGEGGLNIGSLREKNLALLGKWFWRAKTEHDSLWVSVIKSIHGANGLLPPSGPRGPSGSGSVWLNILRAGLNIESLGLNFANSFSKIIDDGPSTNFYNDPWLLEKPLKDRFRRLFYFEEVHHRLLKFIYKHDKNVDSWSWKLDSSGVFTTKRLSRLLDEVTISANNNSQNETLKNYLVLKKVEILILIRRVLKRRVPVRTELDKRGIDLDSVRCPLRDDDVETIEHAFIFCRHSMDLWEKIYKWWGFNSISNLSLSEVLRGNYNRATLTLGSLVWQTIEWSCAYFIWRNRNQKVFAKTSWSASTALMEVQLKSFEWISNRIKK